MSNVIKLRTEETILEEASLWIARLDRQLSDDEPVTEILYLFYKKCNG